ncbi:TlpA family protein disulfide reductase [Mucilaginibacter myungsuensis]|uniref:TlpA family protein disulfide reductase n=1 Tax=Mucilaginibacter myungsuensis TaxID=649104 RepID=A0A929PVS0_9SPHI|nr:TlpA disulfide reductase family protein [Mucilaginibacter myungsuensis]MBE9662073.1 TlpA family protein disulfide reductase [Mucilaginibacter myungsuensis]MDN3599493.1 TlpA disulfide reductase family protein [Mucilaginibacter myungsuensis]
MPKHIAICLSFLLLVNIAQAQKIFQVTLQFDSTIKPQNVRYHYDDGIDLHFNDDTLSKRQFVLKRKYYAPLAMVNVDYTDDAGKQYNNRFFITDKPAIIRFTNKPNEEQELHYSYILNATPIFDSVKNKFWAGTIANRKKHPEESIAFDTFLKKNPKYPSSDSLRRVFQKLYEGHLNRDMAYLSHHADDYQAFWFFRSQLEQTSGGRDAYLQEQLAYVKKVFPKYLNTPGGKRMLERFSARLELVGVGQVSPSFTLKLIDGKNVELKDLKGKYVLLDLWATWCPPCMAEMPFIKDIRAKYPPEKLVIIGISSDRSIKPMKEAIVKQGMNWEHYLDADGYMLRKFSVSAIPVLILIGTDGNMLYKSDHKVRDEDALPKVLAGIE